MAMAIEIEIEIEIKTKSKKEKERDQNWFDFARRMKYYLLRCVCGRMIWQLSFDKRNVAMKFEILMVTEKMF